MDNGKFLQSLTFQDRRLESGRTKYSKAPQRTKEIWMPRRYQLELEKQGSSRRRCGQSKQIWCQGTIKKSLVSTFLEIFPRLYKGYLRQLSRYLCYASCVNCVQCSTVVPREAKSEGKTQEDCGFQMLHDDEIVTSVQAESGPVDNETDEDEDNNESSKIH
ncbi:hypothetical protein TNCV_1577601 [Trichonephila clavipes]|nr:hypothetical protein TNCV_1577601 [Trichonephila clavipes]